MSSRAAVTRAELEISTYGPDYLVENARKPVSLPLLCCVDSFVLHRNMYRTPVDGYNTLAATTLQQCPRRPDTFCCLTSIRGLLVVSGSSPRKGFMNENR
jgi:hypothetical protein